MIPLAVVIGASTAAGFGAERRFGGRAQRVSQRLMHYVLWVAMPVITFFNIAALELGAQLGAGIVFAYLSETTALVCAFVVGNYLLRMPRPSTGALMVASSQGNTGFLGIPIVVVLLGFDQVANAVAYNVLVTAMAVVTIGFSIGAAFGTIAERPRDRLKVFFTKNPALWGAVAGFLAPDALAPVWAVDASRLLVLAIIPIGFFAVGVTLAGESAEQGAPFPPRLDAAVAWALCLKLLVPPVVMLSLSMLVIEVSPTFVVQAAMASGLTNLIVAETYGLDRRLAAASILYGTLICLVLGVAAAALM